MDLKLANGLCVYFHICKQIVFEIKWIISLTHTHSQKNTKLWWVLLFQQQRNKCFFFQIILPVRVKISYYSQLQLRNVVCLMLILTSEILHPELVWKTFYMMKSWVKRWMNYLRIICYCCCCCSDKIGPSLLQYLSTEERSYKRLRCCIRSCSQFTIYC